MIKVIDDIDQYYAYKEPNKEKPKAIIQILLMKNTHKKRNGVTKVKNPRDQANGRHNSKRKNYAYKKQIRINQKPSLK